MRREFYIMPVLLGFAGAVAYLFFIIWKPFFNPIAWAAVFAIVFNPAHERLTDALPSRTLSASLMTVLVIIIIIVPTVLLGIVLVAEVVQTYELVQRWFSQGRLDALLQWFQQPSFLNLRDKIDEVINLQSLDIYSTVNSLMQRLSSFAVNQVTGMVQNFSKTLFSFILMVFTLFFFFRDGKQFTNFIKHLIPLPESSQNDIVRQFAEVITATVVGDLAVALLQGFLGGLAFWVLGFPSPIFWGAFMAFLSILPIVGAPLIYLPAGIILLLQNEYVRAIVLLIWGTVVVSQIDNFLRPVLISGRTRLHTLILFFSILGGLYVFGFLGLIMGPVIAGLLLSLINIYQDQMRNPEVSVTGGADDSGKNTQTEGEV